MHGVKQHVTQLKNRELTYNGVSIIDPKLFDPPSPDVLELLRANAAVRVTSITAAIDQYNRFADIPVSTPTDADYQLAPVRFFLPAKYRQLKVIEYTEELLVADLQHLPRAQQVEYVDRYDEEMEWFLSHKKQDMLRMLVYVVDTLEANSIPWGVGRGSSVSSYILYLIGVHDIHPIKYGLDWREFLRDDA